MCQCHNTALSKDYLVIVQHCTRVLFSDKEGIAMLNIICILQGVHLLLTPTPPNTTATTTCFHLMPQHTGVTPACSQRHCGNTIMQMKSGSFEVPLGDHWFIRNMPARAAQYCPFTPVQREHCGSHIHSPKVNINTNANAGAAYIKSNSDCRYKLLPSYLEGLLSNS